MDALSEMEKSVNSKIKSAVQSVKVWSPETIVSITWQHWHTQGKKQLLLFQLTGAKAMIYGIKCIGRFILWLVFLGFFFGFFFFCFFFLGTMSALMVTLSGVTQRKIKILWQLVFFFCNFENLALMSVQILQHEINFDDRMKTRLFWLKNKMRQR